MIELLKTTLKLLFRNVGFWLCLIVLPVLATFIMSLQQDNLSYYYDNNYNMGVLEIKDENEKVAYYASDGRFVVKVYDASGSELSDYLLDKLARSGMYKVGRLKVAGMTKAEADERVLNDGENDRMGAALYIESDFEERVLNGEYDKALTAYVLSEDERFELLEDKLQSLMQKVNTASQVSKYTKASVMKELENMDQDVPEKTVDFITGKDERGLTKSQVDQKTNMGYAFAFMTLGFVMCGVIVANSVIREQNNDVLKRIKLTGKSSLLYFSSKFIVGVIVSVMLSGVLTICTFFIDSDRMGMDRLSLLLMIFFMGLIFSTLSLLMGILVGNVMGATVTAFVIWCMSSMLSGLYFPLRGTTKLVQALSFIMPQKWFVDGTEMIFVGDKNAWIMLLCVTVAYLFVALGFGSVGLKLRSAE